MKLVEDLPYIQLVDTKFYMPTVNESYYSAVVLINRQQSISWR